MKSLHIIILMIKGRERWISLINRISVEFESLLIHLGKSQKLADIRGQFFPNF